jgi:hypothetical protein
LITQLSEREISQFAASQRCWAPRQIQWERSSDSKNFSQLKKPIIGLDQSNIEI